MNIWKIFDSIEEAVASSQRLPPPFNQWSLMNRHKFMRLMDKMRVSVSPELKLARGVSKDVNRLLSEAQDQADEIVREAREKAKQQIEEVRVEREALLDASEIVGEARKRAHEVEAAARAACDEASAQTQARCQEVRRQAEEYARDLRKKAEDDARRHEVELEKYAIKLLSSMEHEMGRVLQIVRSHRQSVESAPASKADDDTLAMAPADLQGVRVAAAAVAVVPDVSSSPKARGLTVGVIPLGGRRTA